MPPKAGRGRREITDPYQESVGVSALFRFVLWLFLALAQRHGLFERLANFIQALFIEIMDTLGPFGIKVDQLVVLVHGQITSLSVEFYQRATIGNLQHALWANNAGKSAGYPDFPLNKRSEEHTSELQSHHD